MTAKGGALRDPEYVSCDVMVIGGGGAGLRAAIAAAAARPEPGKIALVSKYNVGRACNTYLSKAIVASSGLADNGDSPAAHLEDTLEGGRHINDPAMVSRMTQRIPSEISFLRSLGASFSMQGDALQLLKIPGHRHPRHVFGAQWNGKDVLMPLRRHARRLGIRCFEHVFVTRLFAADGRIGGAAGVTADGRLLVFQAGAIVLATGGYAQIFRNTNNAPGITGDGQALAYGLGVPLKDMEFVQFYPTALGRLGSRLFLNEKLLAQRGVRLENTGGQDLFKRYGHPDPLAVNRDRLAQLVMTEIQGAGNGHGHVVMNLEGLSPEAAAQVAQLLPSAWRHGQRKFDVVPTTHFCMGGIVTSDRCETAVKGLLAVGEAAAGCHGANRLGGNSLAEIFSMGSLAGETAAEEARCAKPPGSIVKAAGEEKIRLESIFSKRGKSPEQLIDGLKKTMWHKAGILRTKTDLEAALDTLRHQERDAAVSSGPELIRFLEFENMRLVAEAVCRAALMREESRGSHFRRDFPGEDNDNWLKNIEVRRGTGGMKLHATAARVSEKGESVSSSR